MAERLTLRNDPIAKWMRQNDIPVTRESWMRINFPDGLPDPAPQEMLDQIPEEFRSEEPESAA